MKTPIIESPSEASLGAQPYSVKPDVMKSIFRGNASVMFIREAHKGNPAFKDWSKRLTYGEKLPRGKFFRKEEKIRSLLSAPIPSVQCASIHL